MTPRPGSRVLPTRQSPQADAYRSSGAWAGELIDAGIEQGAIRHPERLAIVSGERRVGYAELANSIARAAGALRERGVRTGDVVSFQLPNRVEAAIVHYAAIRLGAVSNPISPIYRGREVLFILRQARSRVFVIPDAFRSFDYRTMLAEIRHELPDLEHSLIVGEPEGAGESFEHAVAAAVAVPSAPREADDIALLLYTSGTEAVPKGVLHSHDTLAYECRSIIELYRATGDDRVFMPSPVTHITGLLYGFALPFMLGASVTLQEIWEPAAAAEMIGREGSTFMIGATPFLHALVGAPESSRAKLASLRVFGCGGADVPPALIKEARSTLGIVASRLYGSTECPTATGTAIDGPIEEHADTDGRPIGPEELRIVDEDGAEVSAGTRGNLLVRGPDLCLGYLDGALNAGAFGADGWFSTGDIAFIDERGTLTIAGRAKDIILRGGENLSAKEVEDLLFEHPAVRDVAIVGYPDAVLGERACAVVVASAPVTLEDLTSYLRERRIANQKLPEYLRVVDELPKTASGKVQKYRLREMLAAERDAD
jgi:cyclohexanecarboxylate-CoA ligase